MNDKEIRNILIEYIKTTENNVRIYQEKSIGSSICDVMAVTTHLTGYEIKSNADNYSRLERQTNAYDDFFDKNYIVVGVSHNSNIVSKVPIHWGIIVIDNSAVKIERVASQNPNTRITKNQLNILWKLELLNILTKNNLPAFVYKSKTDITKYIIENLEESKIKPQIVYELLNRDYALYNAKDHTIFKDKLSAFGLPETNNLPVGDIVDSLSEENLSEISLDMWIKIYRQAQELQSNKQTIYKKTAEKREAFNIPYTEIEVTPGVPWVSKNIIDHFVCFLRTGEKRNYCSGYVNYEPITGNWFIQDKRYLRDSDDIARLEHTYGLKNYNALYIFEATLNLREIKIISPLTNKCDEIMTVAAIEKQEKITSLFKEWVFEDEDRIWEIEKAYNELFGQFTNKVYSGKLLEFPEMSSCVKLYDYQKDAIQKIITEKNTLLAFDVGAGKTFIMIAAAMKLRQSGHSRKNMFVVPNNIVGQWSIIFRQMYPNAKILAVEPSSFKPAMRKKLLTQIRDGDYDGIIIAYSCFEQIPLSINCILAQTTKYTSLLNAAIEKVHYTSGSRSALEREKAYITKIMMSLADTVDFAYNEITFDELEVSTLFVDEAHNFKNIPIRSNLKNLRGINILGSRKCLELLQKVRYVQNSHAGRGSVFATGTPLCNSISDVYTMQMYLQYDLLSAHHLDRFDNWVKSFARPERVCEIDVDTSKFRFVNKFSCFFNLAELSAMFSDIAVFYSMKNESDMPTLNNYTEITINKSENLTKYMNKLCERADKIRLGHVEKSTDNMLKISSDGRKAALDLRLVKMGQPFDKTSKVFNCIENTLKIYHENINSTQIIFCDFSTPKNNSFNIYSDIRDRLIEHSIPESEIAFIHSYETETRKMNLYKKFNNGEVRILIGSTFKLGVGANVQQRLKAIHHLDIPWRPSDMIQREGRILRKGNENSEVQIFRYICKGSFDAYSWQILETKQRFISQFLGGISSAHISSDLEESVLTYAQVKALALSQPLMKGLAEKQNELIKLQIVASNYANSYSRMEDELKNIKEQIVELHKKRDCTLQNIAYVRNSNADDFKRDHALTKNILSIDMLFSEQSEKELFSFVGFKVLLPNPQSAKKPYVVLERLGANYTVEMGDKAIGNARRIANFIKKLDDVIKEIEKQIVKFEKVKIDYEGELAGKISFESQKADLEDEIAILEAKI